MATIFPVPENLTQVVELLPFANDISTGLLGISILILIGVVSLVITSAFSIRESFLASGFIFMISSIFLWILELISADVIWVASAIFVVVAIGASIGRGSATA